MFLAQIIKFERCTYLIDPTMRLWLILILSCSLVPSSTHGQQPMYSPVDNIAINCGYSGSTVMEKRSWVGDIGSKYFPPELSQNKESSTSNPLSPPLQNSRVPYGAARLSRSEFSYMIPVTPGPKFVRLHFHASSYQNSSLSEAFFSVGVGQYTLLRNFSVKLTAEFLDLEGIRKEFVVTAQQPSLIITFTPSSSTPGAFAFICGIEVVSMPDILYYSQVERNIVLVGQDNGRFTLENKTVLETMYRINIGGNALSPSDDTGMFRNWEQEYNYLTEAGVSVLPFNKAPNVIKFRDNMSSYAAPVKVYETGRSTGDDTYTKEEIRSYNLTWQFPVDPGFSYMLRLHFCEIGVEITSQGDRVFNIYIAGQPAERSFDILAYSAQYVPFFRDYAILKFGDVSQKKTNISVALQVNPVDKDTKYLDAILNGLEIFKLNDSRGNLGGQNPDPMNTPVQQSAPRKGKTTLIGVVVGAVAGVLVLFIIGFFVIRRGRKVKDSSSDKTTWWGPISFSTTKSNKTRGSSTLPSDRCRYFSLAEIKAATNNFEDIFVIGVGGFGNVYKGYIDNGITPVAIKRLKSESSQGAHEFKTEIEMLSHLRHRHLVSLIGYCDDHGEMILVYEYMARGTLRDHLYKTDNPPLPWKTRLEICIGAARGLHYLHTGAKNTIIHRDVKTTNILLDEKWVAKMSDFGLSKIGSTSVSKAHVTTVVKGSIGYLDPEYYRRQQLSEKSDVYSFGVVLCEVLCGRPPILRNAEKRQVSLADWARSCHRSGSLHQILDPHLTGKIAPECLKKYGEIAVNCMLDDGSERPSMNDVVWGLEFALQLQQNAEENDSVGGGALLSNNGETKSAMEEVSFLNNDSDGTFSCSWDDTSDMMRSTGVTKISSSGDHGTTTNESMKVFSEIYDPKGR